MQVFGGIIDWLAYSVSDSMSAAHMGCTMQKPLSPSLLKLVAHVDYSMSAAHAGCTMQQPLSPSLSKLAATCDATSFPQEPIAS